MGKARKTKLKIASKQFIYTHHYHIGFGLYSIKGELEDLAMKYTETDKYKEIAKGLKLKRDRTKYINDFVRPLEEKWTNRD